MIERHRRRTPFCTFLPVYRPRHLEETGICRAGEFRELLAQMRREVSTGWRRLPAVRPAARRRISADLARHDFADRI